MPHECTTCGRQFDDGSKEMLSGCPNCGGNKFQFQPPGRSAEPDEPASTADSGAVDGEPTSTADQSKVPSTADQSDALSTDDSAEPASATDTVDPMSDPESEAEIDLPDDTAHTADAAGEDTAGATDATEATNAADATATAAADEEFRDAEIDEFRDAEIADDTGAENSAQRDARSAAVSPDEIDDARQRVADAESDEPSEAAARGRGTPQGPPADTPSGADPDEFALSGALGPEDDEPVEKQPVAGSAPEREEPVADEDTDLRALREELNQQFESIKITAPGQYELNLMELYDRKEYIISLQEDGRYVIEMADDYGIDD